MLLAAMQGVPGELYEAARIDGAGRFQQFWKITVPMIMPTIIITTMLRIIWTANYMDLVFVMTGGRPGQFQYYYACSFLCYSLQEVKGGGSNGYGGFASNHAYRCASCLS